MCGCSYFRQWPGDGCAEVATSVSCRGAGRPLYLPLLLLSLRCRWRRRGLRNPARSLHDGSERDFWVPARQTPPPATPLRSPGFERDVKRLRRSSLLTMRPVDIGFCHDTISPCFRDGRSILTTFMDLASGNTNSRDMPMMQIVLHSDGFFSVSNRRLCLYRLCELLGFISAFSRVARKERHTTRRVGAERALLSLRSTPNNMTVGTLLDIRTPPISIGKIFAGMLPSPWI